jgi:hypothetical protein
MIKGLKDSFEFVCLRNLPTNEERLKPIIIQTPVLKKNSNMQKETRFRIHRLKDWRYRFFTIPDQKIVTHHSKTTILHHQDKKINRKLNTDLLHNSILEL